MFRIYLKRFRIALILSFCTISLFVFCYYLYGYKYQATGNIQIKKFSMLENNEMSSTSRIHLEARDEVNKEALNAFKFQMSLKEKETTINYNVHAFYYAWYGNPEFDGKYLHWNHRFLPHWENRISQQYATGKRHQPPDDIGANFFPLLGPYSSRDPSILKKHMEYLAEAGTGVLALSWYPQNNSDSEGKPIDDFVPEILAVAHDHAIKVCFHIEPYASRSAKSVAEDIKYIIEKYGRHPAFYKTSGHNRVSKLPLPLFYIYDSYLVKPNEWQAVLNHRTPTSIRGTSFDALVVGLLVKSEDRRSIINGGFDGFYTYFASSGFTYGSNPNNWIGLSDFAKKHNLLFIPSVGPGYLDTNVRPWNADNIRSRRGGEYYRNSWEKALESKPHFVTVTSFNEWHEGTQIEPAVHGKTANVQYSLGISRPGFYKYESYGNNPNMYLELTKRYAVQF